MTNKLEILGLQKQANLELTQRKQLEITYMYSIRICKCLIRKVELLKDTTLIFEVQKFLAHILPFDHKLNINWYCTFNPQQALKMEPKENFKGTSDKDYEVYCDYTSVTNILNSPTEIFTKQKEDFYNFRSQAGSTGTAAKSNLKKTIEQLSQLV